MSADRLVLPKSLVPEAEAEFRRNDLHAKVVRLANGIFWQKYTPMERKDTRHIRTLSIGETSPVPVMVDGDELQMKLLLVTEYVVLPQDGNSRRDMSGISIRISKPDSDQFAELGRIIKDGSLGIDRMDGGIVRKVGHETYKVIDIDEEVLQGLLEILQHYGEAIGYDPSQTHQSQQEVA